MRVLQVHNHYREPGGEDAAVAAEARLLESRGHTVDQFEARNSPNPILAAGQLAASSWNPVSARAAARTVRRVDPAVVHVHNTWFAMSPGVLRAIKRAGYPIVMTAHNYRLVCSNAMLYRDGKPCELCVNGHSGHAVRYRCYNDSVVQSAGAAACITVNRRLRTWQQCVDVLITLTDFAKSRLAASGVPAARMVTRPNFTPDPGRRPHPPGESRTILFVGRLSPEKGIDLMIEAWERSRPVNLQLAIIGDGPLAKRVSSHPSIRMLGNQPAEMVRKMMLSARALLCPSQCYEGAPLVIIEAFAAGLPVLGSAHGAVGHAVSPLGQKWALPPRDGLAWSNALRRLSSVDVDAEVSATGLLARTVYDRRYTPAVAATSLERIYARASAYARSTETPLQPLRRK